jgi:PPK2 family polyphosphate:nucleotide phosphotransferase
VARSPLLAPIDGSRRLRLDDINPADTAGLEKEEAADRLEKLGQEFAELGNLLAYAGQHSLLVVLQGRDASGKDGAIRKILEFSNIQNAYVHAFKVPTEEERGHDFLWRVHRVTPARGYLALFNRSHYEDVVAVRVHQLAPPEVWKARYQQINAFEELLLANQTIVLKFFLHVSKEEQLERLLEREKDPRTAWKLNPGDWRERPLWNQVTEAYDDVLRKCATPEAPWHVVPADKKWFRNLVVMDRLVQALRPHRKAWIEHLEKVGKQALKEIRALRDQDEGPKKKKTKKKTKKTKPGKKDDQGKGRA